MLEIRFNSEILSKKEDCTIWCFEFFLNRKKEKHDKTTRRDVDYFF